LILDIDFLILVSKHLLDFFLELIVIPKHFLSKRLLVFTNVRDVILKSRFELVRSLSRKLGGSIARLNILVREVNVVVFYIQRELSKEVQEVLLLTIVLLRYLELKLSLLNVVNLTINLTNKVLVNSYFLLKRSNFGLEGCDNGVEVHQGSSIVSST
jgi:hypothetical protein